MYGTIQVACEQPTAYGSKLAWSKIKQATSKQATDLALAIGQQSVPDQLEPWMLIATMALAPLQEEWAMGVYAAQKLARHCASNRPSTLSEVPSTAPGASHSRPCPAWPRYNQAFVAAYAHGDVGLYITAGQRQSKGKCRPHNPKPPGMLRSMDSFHLAAFHNECQIYRYHTQPIIISLTEQMLRNMAFFVFVKSYPFSLHLFSLKSIMCAEFCDAFKTSTERRSVLGNHDHFTAFAYIADNCLCALTLDARSVSTPTTTCTMAHYCSSLCFIRISPTHHLLHSFYLNGAEPVTQPCLTLLCYQAPSKGIFLYIQFLSLAYAACQSS